MSPRASVSVFCNSAFVAEKRHPPPNPKFVPEDVAKWLYHFRKSLNASLTSVPYPDCLSSSLGLAGIVLTGRVAVLGVRRILVMDGFQP